MDPNQQPSMYHVWVEVAGTQPASGTALPNPQAILKGDYGDNKSYMKGEGSVGRYVITVPDKSQVALETWYKGNEKNPRIVVTSITACLCCLDEKTGVTADLINATTPRQPVFMETLAARVGDATAGNFTACGIECTLVPTRRAGEWVLNVVDTEKPLGQIIIARTNFTPYDPTKPSTALETAYYNLTTSTPLTDVSGGASPINGVDLAKTALATTSKK